MNELIISRLKKAIKAITIEDDPFADWSSKVKYDAYDMAQEDIKVFFKASEVTGDQLVDLLYLCGDAFGCDFSNELISAVKNQDRESARALFPNFWDGDDFDPSVYALKDGLNHWLSQAV